MTLKPSVTVLPLLLGDDTSEVITLSPGLLKNYPYGVVALGGNDLITGSSDGEWLFGNAGEDDRISNWLKLFIVNKFGV